MLRDLIRAILAEGGLKLPPGERRDLTPTLVRQAVAEYERFLAGWNRWLGARGRSPVEPVGPSGSSAHAEKDAAEGKDAVYGDVDYLVSFPLDETPEEFGDRRKAQAAVEREYVELMAEYIRSVKPPSVDADATLKPGSIPSQVVLRLSGGELVQVDTVVTFPEHAEWMRGRYVPERGVKGFVSGSLFKALGDYLTLTIGTEGVVARTKGGSRVSSKVRAGVKYERVSGSFRTFLLDVARYLLGPDAPVSPRLEAHPGLEPGQASVEDIAKGIVGLAETLAAAGAADKREMLASILDGFEKGLVDTISRKEDRDIDPNKAAKLRHLADEQLERVRRTFGL